MPLDISLEIVPKVIRGDRDSRPFKGLKRNPLLLSLSSDRVSIHMFRQMLSSLGLANRAPRKSLLFTKEKGYLSLLSLRALRMGLQMRIRYSMYC